MTLKKTAQIFILIFIIQNAMFIKAQARQTSSPVWKKGLA